MKLPVSNPPPTVRLIATILLAALATGTARAQTVLRTLAYHQITQFTNTTIHTYGRSLVMSPNDGRIAMASPWYSSPQRTNLIYAVNFDGSNLRLVDSWPGSAYASVDISADGSRILSWDGGTVRMVNSDGSNPHPVIQVNGGYPDFRISGDGSQVFFSNDRTFGTTPDTGSREPGLYVVNADGSGLREIAGLANFAQFFSSTPAKLAPDGYLYGWNGGTPFGVSADGAKLICYTWTPTNGYRLLGLNSTGTGLREFVVSSTPVNGFNKVGFSGDGTKAFYYLSYTPCCSSGEEMGIFDWDGGARRVLFSSYSTNQSSGALDLHEVSASYDGGKVLFGETSWLYNGDGSGRLELGWAARFAASKILQWGLYYRGVMDGSGTRFAFLTPINGDSSHLQVATAEINPVSLGLAPSITNASVAPAYIRTNGPSPVFAFRPVPAGGLVPGGGAQAGVLYHGISDPATWQGSTLHDDGASGDAVKNDGLYSDNSANFNSTPAIGPRTLRYKAESLGSDGAYHSTAIDLAPFFVVGPAPTGPAPSITSLTPPSAPAGAEITVIGSNFDPIATNNYVLFGNLEALIVSGGASQLLVVVPPGLPAGQVPVTVSGLGQTSAAAAFGNSGPPPDFLEIFLLAGVNVHGTVGKTYRLDYLTDLSNTNSWAPLATNVLPTNPYFWVDVSSTNQPRRFYRAVQLP